MTFLLSAVKQLVSKYQDVEASHFLRNKNRKILGLETREKSIKSKSKTLFSTFQSIFLLNGIRTLKSKVHTSQSSPKITECYLSYYKRLALILSMLFGVGLANPLYAATLTLNANGGKCAATSSDVGLVTYVGDKGQFQVERCRADGTTPNLRQYYNTSQIPPATNLFNSIMLKVGNITTAAYSGFFNSDQEWTSVSSTGGSASGDGTTVHVMSTVVGGLTYQVTQTVSYIFPNDFFSVTLSVDIPAGNTQEVNLYSWTDIMLDGDDNGTCSYEPTFPEHVLADNTLETLYSGFRQRSISNHWDRYWCGLYYEGPDFIDLSDDLPNSLNTANHDVGAAVQWEVGTVANTTYTAEYDYIFSINHPSLTKRYGPVDGDNDHTINAGETTQLTFTITNRPGNPAQGSMNFTETLPTNVTIVGTPTVNQCGGTVSTTGSNVITLTGGSIVGGTQTCTIVVDVTSNIVGVYDDPSSNVSVLNNLENLTQAELTVVAPPYIPTFGPNAACSGYTTTILDPNTTQADTGYNGFTTPFNSPVGTFNYTEFENTANHLSIKVTDWANAISMTDGVGDDAGYTGPELLITDWDRAASFTRKIQASEAGTYSVNLNAGDDHVFIYVNGVQIYAQADAYNVAPVTLANLTLAAGDNLDIRVVEEHAGNTTLDIEIVPLFTPNCGTVDLEITKSVIGDATPNIGETVTFSLLIEYLTTPTATSTATDVVVTDIVPAGFTYVANSMTGIAPTVAGITADQSSPASGTGLEWTIASIANGSSTTVTFQAIVKAP